MKAKIILSALLSFSFCLLFSQVPQGFNYQAILRNSNGLLITRQTIPVRISIVTSLIGGQVKWQEEHSSVSTNQYGLISIAVGTGTKTGGSATSFSAIDWGAQTLFLKTEIKYQGQVWIDMGTSQIWSVPYSLVAKKVEGPFDKLGITGTTDNMDEALFEVKNKEGNTVFAVYNEGVRVYVDDGSKGTKGGFAVGGYDDTKGVHNLLTVSSDSVRVYVDNNPAKKGTKGGFAVGGYDMAKGGTPQNYLNVTPDSTRVYLNNSGGKGLKGGFAVGGYDMAKGSGDRYLSVTPDSTIVYVRSLNANSSSTFNIVGFDQDNARKYLLQANPDTIGISGVLNLKNNLLVAGNINVSGNYLQDTSLVIDVDGNTYKTIRIGQQIWMAEDLKATRYSDGTAIPNITYDTVWTALTTPAYCWFDNDAATYKPTYGVLYNWYVVDAYSNGNRNVCPTGWHVPSELDWSDLSAFLGSVYVGGLLKETGIAHWMSPNLGATNVTGFTALPGGSRTFDGIFDGIGLYENWWTTTGGEGSASSWSVDTNSEDLISGYNNNNNGAAVRCLYGL
ncbi:MAG: fibrobacter succinogenes major paralogous domain-containing protein [Bacteroidia bacterium]|nr:fibrobacter succinogenes major paralogous domain-containing protein [Bacteroidia bacterium]